MTVGWSRQCLFPRIVSTNGACSDNTGQTQILQCHPRKSVTISLLHTNYYNYSVSVSLLQVVSPPSIVFQSLAKVIKENLLDTAHLADEIYSSHSKENQLEGKTVCPTCLDIAGKDNFAVDTSLKTTDSVYRIHHFLCLLSQLIIHAQYFDLINFNPKL